MNFEVIPVRTMCNAYILRGRRIALVDTLTAGGYKKLAAALSSEGLSAGDIEFVLITHAHPDHTGNLARIKELSGAKVIAGAADAGVIEGTESLPEAISLNPVAKMMGMLPAFVARRMGGAEKVAVDRRVSDGDVIEELGLEVV